ncbi:MAG: hypothetical protein OXN17_20105 [Candidatus Poribacteria bacterium]|nr:hypothetical protein [Candidatus Poribacteria bacterium]MDE0504877.1 hypothetical protein [Candidatus Poribacteria bacterium]
MSIHRLFTRQFLLKNRVNGVAIFCSILLMSGCGGEETINTPFAENPDVAPAPTSSPYFPIALGNRWTYRNPDGSEWSRQVTESEVFDADRYHSFSYSQVKKARHRAIEENIPRWLRPIEHDYHDLFDSVGPAEYFTYADRLVRPIKVTEFNDAIRKIVLDSGGETPEWNFGLSCRFDLNGHVCLIDKGSRVFNPPGILTMLFKTAPHVASQSELTPLRFPLMANQSYTALELRLRSKSDAHYLWEFYVDTTIVATTGNAPELVATSTGTFENCLKIQYEAGQISIKTLQFVDVGPFAALGQPGRAELAAFELTFRDELADLLANLMPRLGLQTMWLAPGVGPVKIETPNGIAELIDYEIKAVDL